jgi:hypothetical protein
MVFFGPSGFAHESLTLAVPLRVWWVGALVALSAAVLRAHHQLTARCAHYFPILTLLLYMVGGYSMAYVCIHIAHTLESAAVPNAVVMMMRWAHLYAAVFLIIAPVFALLPSSPEADQVRLTNVLLVYLCGDFSCARR